MHYGCKRSGAPLEIKARNTETRLGEANALRRESRTKKRNNADAVEAGGGGRLAQTVEIEFPIRVENFFPRRRRDSPVPENV